MSRYRYIAVLSLCAFSAGCSATARPALYPNEHYNSVGEAQAQADINACIEKAKQSVGADSASNGQGGKIARDTAVGAAGGAAVGSVAGAIGGNGAGEGAAAGAASGAVAGLFYGFLGLFQSKSEPDPVFVNFVNKCLQDEGYEPIGWK